MACQGNITLKSDTTHNLGCFVKLYISLWSEILPDCIQSDNCSQSTPGPKCIEGIGISGEYKN